VPFAGRRSRAREAWDAKLQGPLDLAGRGGTVARAGGAPEAWFLGPRAENVALMHELVAAAIDSHAAFRRGFHPEDPTHLTQAMRTSPGFQVGVDRLRLETAVLLEKLQLSAPFSSMRYQGHMLWDQAMPGLVGLVAGLMYNQNNVAAEASPVTTRLEIEAGNDLCRMLGYTVVGPGQRGMPSWGHITSGGTVANIEAMWAFRNLKFTGIAVRAALREVPALAAARDIEVPMWGGGTARLIDLDPWTLMNLDIDAVAGVPAQMAAVGIDMELLQASLAAYSQRNVGLVQFYRSFMGDVTEPPVFLAPATGHYSWPKAATLLGLGQNAVWVQRVDQDARLSLDSVADSLEQALRRRVPVLATVAVIGSTEESAVDPLEGLLALREQFRARGLNFAIHADAAWGGYFRSMLREGEAGHEAADDPLSGGVPICPMSDYVQRQYEALPMADSITVDPHKGGYVPYPAGALCYRNAAVRDAVSLRAPVVFHNQTEPTIGIYGVEGSKPGSAAAAVWLAHRVIRPDRSGYGRILGQCMWTAKRLYCRLVTMEDERFTVTPFNQLPAERAGKPPGAVEAEREALRDLVPLDNAALLERIRQEPATKALFNRIGSDQVILAFALNPKRADGRPNTSLALANALNEAVFARCSVMEPREDLSGLDLVLTSSRFDPSVYGQPFVDAFCRRMGVVPEPGAGVDFLICTTMDPWTTQTERGDFQGEIIEALRRAAYSALEEVG
jgi:glutamate/tyrosine decarboxylase-like PLP-dependent enzyme